MERKMCLPYGLGCALLLLSDGGMLLLSHYELYMMYVGCPLCFLVCKNLLVSASSSFNWRFFLFFVFF
ncbi:hypothetical protein CsSME_00044387 [Camellia sinensis var. sinensis]